MPVGKARIARAGRDLTIVAYSAMVHEALAVADELADRRLGRSKWSICAPIKPLDTDTVMASVARTGRLLASAKPGPGAA